MEKNNLVAVYGTLREGEGNWSWALKGKADRLSTERLSGFGMVSLGGFPAIYTEDEKESSVVVELYKVDDETFRRLDGLEGYPSFYDRKQVDTSLGRAWIYFIDRYKDSSSSPKIESGDWIEERKRKWQENTQKLNL